MFSNTENAIFGIVSILSAMLSLLPMPIHLRANNTGIILMIGWCFIGLFNKGVNALAFNGNLEVSSMIGCDISGVIERTWQFGLCCSSFLVLQRLEHIASLRAAHTTAMDRRRRLFTDIAVGLGVPLLQVPLFFVVQPYRMDVIENVGCNPPIYNSIAALFLYYLWRLLISFLCAVYAVLILRWFFLRRRQFAAALSSHGSGLSQRKYFRLFFLAVCEATLIFIGQSFLSIRNLQLTGLLSYKSWSYVHEGFNTVNIVPMNDTSFTSQQESEMEILRYLALTPGIAIFAFFGFSEDAKKLYFSCLKALLSPFAALRTRRTHELPDDMDSTRTKVDTSVHLKTMMQPDADVVVIVQKDTVAS
nr:putative pheromone receptor [Tranzscheliella williamsii]